MVATLTVCSTVTVAASPDANARQCAAPSAAAMASSKLARVGLLVRLYSNPRPYESAQSTPDGSPGLRCANVVAKEIGATTAPDTASGPLPT